LSTPLLSSVRLSNDEHKNWVRRKLLQQFGAISGLTVAVWGLTYKPGTDTLRRSLAVELCDWLIGEGVNVRVHDPEVKLIPERWAGKVVHCTESIPALDGASALVVGTEWPLFKQSADAILKFAKPGFTVIDANRHLQSLAGSFKDAGITYVAVGAPIKVRLS
jgi:UDPglucose 6-dehydrogenase